MHDVECLWQARTELGEGPLWVPRLDTLLFVDIDASRLLSWRRGDARQLEWSLPEACCWLIERADGDGFLAGLRSRVVHLRLEDAGPQVVSEWARPEAQLPGNRFNDAKADVHGRVWAGTMDNGEKAVSGSLYRIDGREVLRVDHPYGIANGPAFSPDGRTLYHTDTASRTIYAFDCSPAGELRAKRVHLRFEGDDGYPDGMCCDADGGLWVAHFGGGRVSRFTPDGRLDRHIALPASQVTSCAFGGDRLDELYVTTACRGRGDEPLAGALFRLHPGVRGLPPGRFGRAQEPETSR